MSFKQYTNPRIIDSHHILHLFLFFQGLYTLDIPRKDVGHLRLFYKITTSLAREFAHLNILMHSFIFLFRSWSSLRLPSSWTSHSGIHSDTSVQTSWTLLIYGLTPPFSACVLLQLTIMLLSLLAMPHIIFKMGFITRIINFP